MSAGTHSHKESVRYPKVGIIGTVSLLTWMLGPERGSSGRWDFLLSADHLSRHHS